MNFKKCIKYIVSIGFLSFLLIQMDIKLLIHSIDYTHKNLLLLAVGLIIGQIFFLNLRWHAYLNVGRSNIPFETSVVINLAGYFANLFFIASIGGIIAKSGLAIKAGVPIIHSIFATFLDRFMTLVALIVFSAMGVIVLKDTLDEKVFVMLTLSVSAVILSIVFAILLLRSGILKDFILAHRGRSRGLAILRNFLEDYNLMSITFFYSLMAQIFFIVSVYILALGFETEIDAVKFFALVPILALVSSLPISFGGWGVREGAFVYGLGLIGFSMENAFMLSVQVGLVTLIAPILVGLPYVLTNKVFFKHKAT